MQRIRDVDDVLDLVETLLRGNDLAYLELGQRAIALELRFTEELVRGRLVRERGRAPAVLQDMQKLASPAHKTDPANAAAAPKLARQFNCVQCHGPALLGLQHIPRLAGQQFEYLKTQMRGFKAQTRADLDGNMTSAAQGLTDKDIDVLVDYISGLGAP